MSVFINNDERTDVEVMKNLEAQFILELFLIDVCYVSSRWMFSSQKDQFWVVFFKLKSFLDYLHAFFVSQMLTFAVL